MPDPTALIGQLAAAVEMFDPHLFVCSGDIVDGWPATTPDEHHEALLWLRAVLACTGVPYIAVPGNHDHAPAVRATFASRWRARGWEVEGVDTTVGDRPRGRWPMLAPATTHRVLVGHHPMRSASQLADFGADNADRALRAAASDQLTHAVITGHVHQPYLAEHTIPAGTVTLVGAASAAFGIDHTAPEWTIDDTVACGLTAVDVAADGTTTAAVLTVRGRRLDLHRTAA